MHHSSDIKCVERVQRYFTCALCKRVGLSYLCYSIPLQSFNLQSLEYRRVYCDLVQCYIFFSLTSTSTIYGGGGGGGGGGGHSFKLKPIGSLSVYSCRYNFFFLTTSYKSVKLITIKCY